MPVARSTLLLEKLPEQQLSALDPRWQDDVLRYGQKIRLLAHPAAQVRVCLALLHPRHSAGGVSTYCR
jgi:hypothetical protein